MKGRPHMDLDRANKLMLALILFVGYIYTFPRWADWSQNSRLDLTLAIVDRGTLSIDAYYQNTGDYALFEGHHYTDKAPGPSFLAVPVYAAMRLILRSEPIQSLINQLARSPAFVATLQENGTGLLSDKVYFAVVLYIVTIVVIAIPSAVLGILLYCFLRELGVSQAWSVIVTLMYGLATNAFTYSGAFFSHQLVAFLLFGAFFLSFQMQHNGLPLFWAIIVGFMLGYALISEYPSILIAGVIFFYNVLALPRRRWLIALVLGGIPPVLLLAVYNWMIFHTILPVGYRYSELYTEQHSTGFLSLTYPHFTALWGITFGLMRGLFFVSPVLLLAIAGLWAWWRSGQYRLEWAICLWATLSFFLFNGSSIMWQGGFSVGPRYLVPMLPFLSMGMGGYVKRWGKYLWARGLLLILTTWSFLVIWAETLAGQNYPDWSRNPLFEYSFPLLANNDIARNLGMTLGLRGWISLLPLIVFLLGMFWILVRVNRNGLIVSHLAVD